MGVRRTIAAFLAVSLASSTRDGRAEAQRKAGRYNRLLWIVGIILWVAIILGGIFPAQS